MLSPTGLELREIPDRPRYWISRCRTVWSTHPRGKPVAHPRDVPPRQLATQESSTGKTEARIWFRNRTEFLDVDFLAEHLFPEPARTA